MARLQPELLSGPEAEKGADLVTVLDRRFSRAEIEKRAASAQGRRTMFREAGLMLEMANYAERNGGAELAPLVANLRNHATAIRMATIRNFLKRSQ